MRKTITFRDFMEQALYDDRYGYYSAAGRPCSQIGFDGADFYTSPEVTPLFAELVAIQVKEMDRKLGGPEPFIFVEIGAGNGRFAFAFLTFLKHFPDLLCRLKYLIIDRSPQLIKQQQRLLEGFSNIQWLPDPALISTISNPGIQQLPPAASVVFCNELFDALPVHRITVKSGELREVYVDYEESDIFFEDAKELYGNLSTTRIEEYFNRPGFPDSFPADYPDGYKTEVNLGAGEMIQQIAAIINNGYLITIDYGYLSEVYYARQRTKGTILSYYRHKSSEDFYNNIGRQDITAHVDFSSLAFSGRDAGMRVEGFTSQMNFLAALAMSSKHHSENELLPLRDLVHPGNMGREFQVMIQSKLPDTPEAGDLTGMRFKSFFKTMLTYDDVDS